MLFIKDPVLKDTKETLLRSDSVYTPFGNYTLHRIVTNDYTKNNGLDGSKLYSLTSAKVVAEDITPNLNKQLHLKVPLILDDATLANFLNIKKRTLYYIANPYCQRGSVYSHGKGLYKVVSINKRGKDKNGKYKKRYLQIPNKFLKSIQRKLGNEIFTKYELPSYVTGFIKGKSIVDTAKEHCAKNIVVSLDISNFFNSIHQWHIEKMLCELFGYSKQVSKLISEICTYKFFLPQGSPSSPVLSNLVGYYFFDKEVKQIADKYGFDVTRYADDITLSTNRDIPKIENKTEDGKIYYTSEIDNMISEIDEVLKRCKFKLNRRKTKIMRGNSRKYVLGVVTNKEPNIIRKKYRILKSILHNLSFNSIEHEAAKTNRTEQEFLAWLKGNLCYLNMVNPKKGGDLLEQLDLILKSNGYDKVGVEHIKICYR